MVQERGLVSAEAQVSGGSRARERDRPVKGNESTDSITLRAHGCLNEQQGRGGKGARRVTGA